MKIPRASAQAVTRRTARRSAPASRTTARYPAAERSRSLRACRRRRGRRSARAASPPQPAMKQIGKSRRLTLGCATPPFVPPLSAFPASRRPRKNPASPRAMTSHGIPPSRLRIELGEAPDWRTNMSAATPASSTSAIGIRTAAERAASPTACGSIGPLGPNASATRYATPRPAAAPARTGNRDSSAVLPAIVHALAPRA